jgi:hypothetical protein
MAWAALLTPAEKYVGKSVPSVKASGYASFVRLMSQRRIWPVLGNNSFSVLGVLGGVLDDTFEKVAEGLSLF